MLRVPLAVRPLPHATDDALPRCRPRTGPNTPCRSSAGRRLYAGAAGLGAALSAARCGTQVYLIEAATSVGGTVAGALIHTLAGLYDSAGELLQHGLAAELIEPPRKGGCVRSTTPDGPGLGPERLSEPLSHGGRAMDQGGTADHAFDASPSDQGYPERTMAHRPGGFRPRRRLLLATKSRR